MVARTLSLAHPVRDGVRPLRSRLLALALIVTAAAALAVSAERTWRETSVSAGLTLRTGAGPDADGVVVASVDPGGPANLAGLRAGDRVLEIAGHAVTRPVAAQDLVARAAAGQALTVTVRRAGVTEIVRVRPVETARWRPDRIAASLVALLFWTAAASAVARPRPGAPVTVFLAWCLAGALVLGVTWTGRGDPVDWVLFWIDRVARLALPALWVHLALSLRREAGARRWLPLAYAPALGLLLAEVWLAGLGGALRAVDPVSTIDWLRGRAEVLWLSAGLAAGLALLVRATRSASTGEARARARWFVTGTVAGLLPYFAFAALPSLLTGEGLPQAWISLPFLGLLPLMFTSAVLDYRLMDLALFLRRAISITSSVLFSVVLFVGLLTLARVVVPAVLQPPGIAPALIAAVITALLAPAIRAGTRDMVGRMFYRRRYDFRRALARVARDLNAERDLPRLQEMLERRIAEALDAGSVQLLLAGGGGELIDPATREPAGDVLPPGVRLALEGGDLVSLATSTDVPSHMPRLNGDGVQVLVPLRVERALIAVLAVGPAPDSAPLDSDDMDLLRTVAGHAAAAVAGALHLADLRRQVQLVEQLQAKTEALIDSTPIGMAVIDPDGVVRHWNAALEQILGLPRSEALNRPFGDVLPGALRAVVREFLRQSPLPQRSRAYRVRIGAREPEKLVDISAAPLRNGDGAASLLLTIDDVTERVRLEEQLIQQDRLASVGLLAAGVAHEINTPLTGISSFAQMMLSDATLEDPRRPLLETIVQQAGRAAQIARGLLRFSRPGPVLETSLGPVDIRELFHETVGLLGPQIRKSAARVTCEFGVNGSGASLIALADRARLQQVAINLLLNALDAVEKGGEVLVHGAHDGESVWFSIADNGVGIPEHLRARIFDPFFTTKKPGQGTGLGLSISYSIVREHGGTLTADSEPGRGTTMRVTVPAFPSSLRHAVPAIDAEIRRAG